MEACREALTLKPEDLLREQVWLAEDGGRITGYYVLSVAEQKGLLDALFVEPEWIGTGTGSALWRHMTDTAVRLGVGEVWIHSDPHAADFYRKMGAEQAGEVPSTVFPDRQLPLMCYRLK